MKRSWKVLKILFALVFIVGISYWAFTALRPNIYRGTSLNFPIGHGTVALNNPSPEAVTIQIIDTGSRSFRVLSNAGLVSGTSTRQATGATSRQVFEVSIPQGLHEFSVVSGINTSLVANSSMALDATVYGLSEVEAQTVSFGTVLGIILAVLYILSTTRDNWLPLILPQSATDMLPTPDASESGQGDAVHSYGDNRKPSQV